MDWERLELGPIGTNCYILVEGGKALIVDPGGNSERIQDKLAEFNASPEAILLTHAHFDHIGAVEELRHEYNIPVYLHESEWEWMENPDLNGSAFFPVDQFTAQPPDYKLEEGSFSIESFHFEIKHTPGHSPGSVSFISHEDKLILSGDVIFKQGVGRTDLPGGNIEHLLTSIKNKIYILEDEYRVLPGHGSDTTIGEEKRTNPFTNELK